MESLKRVMDDNKTPEKHVKCFDYGEWVLMIIKTVLPLVEL